MEHPLRARKYLQNITIAVGLLISSLTVAGVAVVTNNAEAQDQSLPIKATFYYPWFPETWHSDDHYTPTLGRYSSSDREVVRKHFAAMKYAGLDAAIASWWGQNTPTGSRLPLLLEEAAGSGFAVTPYYERECCDSDPSQSSVAADLAHLNGLATSTGWLRVNGRPVLFVYNSGATGCQDVTRFKNAQADAGTSFYLSMKVFPGYADCVDKPDTWHQYGPAVNYSTHGNYHANISPGFWHHTEESPRLNRDLTRWCQDVLRLNAAAVDWKLVTSFNEWGEGTSVESAVQWQSNSGYGAYLDVLNDVFVDRVGCGGVSPSPTVTSTPTTSSTTSTSAPAVQTVVAAEDAYVDSARPALNFGDNLSLLVDGSPTKRSYLKFTSSRDPVKATVQVYGLSNHQEGYDVAAAGSTWNESTLTYDNAPTPGPAAASSGPVTRNSWTSVDVTSLVNAGQNTLVLRTSSPTNLKLDSSEDVNPPRLVLQYDGSTQPTTTAPTTSATTTTAPTTTAPTTTITAPTTTTTPPPGGQTVVWALGDICDDDNEAVDCDDVGNLIRQDPETDAVLALGDLQYENGELANFNTYYEPKMGAGKGLKVKTYPAPGNHEYLTAGARGYFDYWGARAGDPAKGYYAVNIGGWKVVAGNSNCSYAGGCGATSPQGTFIAQQLASTEQCEIVFGHHPAITDGNYSPGTAAGKELFDRAFDGRAELYLSGHDHEYQRFAPRDKALNVAPDGVRPIVSGAGGKNLTAFQTTNRSEYRQNTKFGAVRLVLNQSGYTGSFVNVDGVVMDTFSGTCHN